MIDMLDKTKTKFIGRPLRDLFERHGVNREGFALYLEDRDGSNDSRKRLGSDLNLSLLISRNKQFSLYPIKDIVRYYGQIHVVITPPEEGTDERSV